MYACIYAAFSWKLRFLGIPIKRNYLRIVAFRENSYKAQIVALSGNLQIDALSRNFYAFWGCVVESNTRSV